MKKLASLILALSLILSLGACTAKPVQTQEPVQTESPDPTPEQTPATTPEPGETPAAGKDNLKGFYEELLEKQLLPEGMELTDDIINDFYEGISDIELKQRVIFVPAFSLSASEIALFELQNPADAEKVLEIIAKRLDFLDNLWKEYLPQQYEFVKKAKIVQNGNFIMLVIAEKAEEVETAFNELFETKPKNLGAAG